MAANPEFEATRAGLIEKLADWEPPEGADPAEAVELRDRLENLIERFEPRPGQSTQEAVAELREAFDLRIDSYVQGERIDALVEAEMADEAEPGDDVDEPDGSTDPMTSDEEPGATPSTSEGPPDEPVGEPDDMTPADTPSTPADSPLVDTFDELIVVDAEVSMDAEPAQGVDTEPILDDALGTAQVQATIAAAEDTSSAFATPVADVADVGAPLASDPALDPEPEYLPEVGPDIAPDLSDDALGISQEDLHSASDFAEDDQVDAVPEAADVPDDGPDL